MFIGALEIPTAGTVRLVEDVRGIEAIVAKYPQGVARGSDALVAMSWVYEEDLSAVEPLLGNAKLGTILSAWNFDPTEDYPDGFDLTWATALINDFRGINDDLGTLEGVRGEHFTRLLSWQPRVDKDRTALLAWVTPEHLEAVSGEPDAAPRLAEAFALNGYDGIILSGGVEDASGMETLTMFAEGMRRGASLPLILATRRETELVVEPFAMHFWRGPEPSLSDVTETLREFGLEKLTALESFARSGLSVACGNVANTTRAKATRSPPLVGRAFLYGGSDSVGGGPNDARARFPVRDSPRI